MVNGSIVHIPLNGSILRWDRMKLITGIYCTRHKYPSLRVRANQVPHLTHLERGDVLGVEVVLDVADDAARLAHAPLAQQHDLEVVASAVTTRGSPGERHGGRGGDHS